MADLRIDIDGEALDLTIGAEDSFYITRQIHDLINLETRNADFTKQIDVPATAKNIRLLKIGNIFDPAESIKTEGIPCNIILDGVSVAIDASLLIGLITNNNLIRVGIFYGNFTFFTQVVGNLQDLDLSTFAFQYDLPGIAFNAPQAGSAGDNLGNTNVQFNVAPTVAPVVGDILMIDNAGVDYDFAWGQVITVISPVAFETSITFIGANTVSIYQEGGLVGSTSGVVFAQSDWFNIFNTIGLGPLNPLRSKMDIELGGFWFYTKEIIEKLVTDAGFTLNISRLDTTVYNKIALACPNPLFILQNSDSEAGEQNKTDTTSADARPDAGNVTAPVTFTEPLNTHPDAPFELFIDYRWNSVDTAVVLQADLQLNVLQAFGNGIAEVRITQNGTPIATQQFIIPVGTTFVRLEATVTAILNDTFRVELFAQDGPGNNDGFILALPTSKFFLFEPGGAPGRTITNPADFLPDMSKTDFLKGILAMFNIIMQTDNLAKTVTFEDFTGIKDNPEQSLEMDISQDFKRNTFIPSYFQNSAFKYKEERTLTRARQDVDFIFNFDDARLQLQGVVIQLPFGACDNSLLYDKVTPPVVTLSTYAVSLDGSAVEGVNWAVGESTANVPSGEAQSSFKVGQYLGASSSEFRRISGIPTTTTIEVEGRWININAGGGVSNLLSIAESENLNKIAQMEDGADYWMQQGAVDVGNIPPLFGTTEGTLGTTGIAIQGGKNALFPDNLLWSNLINTEYNELLTAIQRPLVLQAFFIMTPAEFQAIDFLRPVYLNNPINGEFYINKIDQYKAGSPVRIELVRISEFS